MKRNVTIGVLFAMIFSYAFAYEAILKSVDEEKGQYQATENPIKIVKAVVKENSPSASIRKIENTQQMFKNFEHDPETVPVKGSVNLESSRFASTISYGEGSNGLGGFIFNEGDSAAVWYRPDTECTVEGVQLYIFDGSELTGTEVTIAVREVVETTSTGVPANGEFDFSYYNTTTGDFMGATIYEQTFSVTSSDVYPVLLDFDFPAGTIDVGANDFAIQIIGNFGGDEADLLYYAGVGGAGTTYNHGFKYYATGASYCDEGCWVPRLNFVVDAKVDYYGDPPPFVTEVEDLPDVYSSCDAGPYYATANIVDVGTASFTGALTSVVFSYDAGAGTVSTELVGTGVDDVFTGEIPFQDVGTTVNYWWTAVDNGDANPDGGVQHTVDLSLSPKTFTINEYTAGADVLVLDDGPNPTDASYALRIGAALYDLGYSVDFWNTKLGGVLTDCELGYYDHLVVIQGLNSQGNFDVGGQLEADVMAFMDAGGNLLFSSADYIYGIDGDADGWTTTDGAEFPFLANYLHTADYWSDANYFGAEWGSDDTLYTGIEDNLISGAIDTFYVHSPEASNWADEIFPDDDSESIFNVYSTTDEDLLDAGGVMFEGDYKMAFIPWHLEGVDDDLILYEILENTMVWFGVESVPVVFSVDGPNGPMFSQDDQVITATVADAEGDAFTVDLYYSVEGSDFVTTAMADNGDGTFSATIPGQVGGTTVDYYISAADAGGSFVTIDFSYFVYAPSADILFVLNNEMSAGGYPGLYYLYDAYETGDLFTWPDFWESGVNGLPTADLLAFYDTVIEITTTADYPFYGSLGGYYDGVLSDWLALGNKNYVLAGDETFGIVNTTWSNEDFVEGSFFNNMGVASSLNDLAGGGVSQLFPVEDDAISGKLFTAIGADILYYDPEYEIEFANWLDGVVPTADASVSFTDVSGNAVGVNKEWANGNKTVFLGFDPLSLNGDPYVWWGAKEEGALAQSLGWFDLGVLDNDELAQPADYSLNNNYPNPFNPTTTISFSVPEASHVELKIFNMLGMEVATLYRGDAIPGSYDIKWNGKSNTGNVVPSGVYFYRVDAGSFTETKKMVLLK